MSNFDDQTRELRELISTLEKRHREYMEPYYRELVRYEAMQMRPRAIVIPNDFDPQQLATLFSVKKL
jgi:hypothetical protein